MGYEYMWENTAKVLLDGNRMVHSRNVTYDIADYGQDKVLGPPSDKPDKVDLDRDFHEMLRDIVPGGIKTSKPPEDQTPASVKDDEQRGDSLRGDSQPQDYDPGSPAIGTPDFSEYHYGGVEVDLTQQPNIPWPRTPRSSPESWYQPRAADPKDRSGRGAGVERYEPHTAVTDQPRAIFLATMDQVQRLDQDAEVFSARMDLAMKELQAGGHRDPQAIIYAASVVGQHAQKDMNWKKALDSNQRSDILTALELEMTSLQKTILTAITKDDDDFNLAVKIATPGRLLLDIKRSGKYKVRGVKQGFKEDKELSDGPDFIYYSNVVKLNAVRLTMFKRRRRGRITGIKDVSVAFLQSDPYPDGQIKYISLKNPITGSWQYFRQTGPIYGEASAPVRWEKTIAPWLEEQGFVRGCNEPGVFYMQERDLLLLLYVDDLLAEGERSDVEWIFNLLSIRFDCKDTDYLEPGTTIDYLGMDLIATEDAHCISMEKYIQNAVDILNLQDYKKSTMPMTAPIETDDTLLVGTDVTHFMSALGMLGWLASTARPDVAYTFSRIA